MTLLRPLLTTVFSICVITAPSLAAERHPDYTKYEYRVIDYKGSPPEGTQRFHWRCWDDKVKSSLSCNFVAGPLSDFRYIYKSKDQFDSIDTNNICDLLYLDVDKIAYDNISASRRLPEDRTDCQRLTLSRLKSLNARRAMALTLRQESSNCLGDADETSYAVKSARDDIKRAEKDIDLYHARCERDRDAEASQNSAERAEAAREASDNLNASVDYSSLVSNDRISCFGGCQTNWVSPRGPYSTITSRAWGDRAPPDTLTGVRSAR